MRPVRRYQIAAFTLITGRLIEVRSVELPATGLMRAIMATKSLHPDARPLVYRAREVA
ncbi:hypothetical protein GCM10009412_15870 [Aeromonas salmonicida subsp. achromogenes]|jgi:hypothetical protein